MVIGQYVGKQTTLIPVNYKAFNRMSDALNVLRKLDFDPSDFISSQDGSGVHVSLRDSGSETINTDERHFQVELDAASLANNVGVANVHGGEIWGEIHGTQVSNSLTTDNGESSNYADVASVNFAANGYIYAVVQLNPTTMNAVDNVTALWSSAGLMYYDEMNLRVQVELARVWVTNNVFTMEESWHGGDIPVQWFAPDGDQYCKHQNHWSLHWNKDHEQIWKWDNISYANNASVLVKDTNAVDYFPTNVVPQNCGNVASNEGTWGKAVGFSRANHVHYIEWANECDYANNAGNVDWAENANHAYYCDECVNVNLHDHCDANIHSNLDSDCHTQYWHQGNSNARNWGVSIGASNGGGGIGDAVIGLDNATLIGAWECTNTFTAGALSSNSWIYANSNIEAGQNIDAGANIYAGANIVSNTFIQATSNLIADDTLFANNVNCSHNLQADNINCQYANCVNINCDYASAASNWQVANVQVVGAQGGAIADIGDPSGSDNDGTARGKINDILAALRGHGLIATAP